MASELIPYGEIDAAADITTGLAISTPASKSQLAVDARVKPAAEAVLAGNPAVVAAAAAAVEAALAAADVKPKKCVHLEGSIVVWDTPGATSATHYVLPDSTGALVVTSTVWPTPGSTPVLNT